MYRKDFPKLYFFYGSKKEGKKSLTYGEYCNYGNTIKIWCGPHTNFNDLASTMLHEYSHYLQFWPWYTRYKNMYTYETNPYELEARESKTKSISLRRDFLMKQKAKNYQNEHDRISNALHSNLVQDTTKKDIQDRIGKLQKLGASAVNNIKD